MTAVSVSVIVSTYDAPGSLRLCLAGYKRQSMREFELIVADDGSDSETKKVVDEFKQTPDFEVKHIWHENKGCYGVTAILNRAVLSSRGDLLVFSHGDCIPQRDFVKSHVDSFIPKSFRCGGRVYMDLNFCQTLSQSMVENGYFEKYLSPFKRLKYEWAHFKNIFYITARKRNRPHVYGSNMSIDRGTFFNINGYDEDFIGAGSEDDDIRNRLMFYGAKLLSLWNKAFVFHIDHAFDKTRLSHPARKKGFELFQRKHKVLKSARCYNGLVKENTYVAK